MKQLVALVWFLSALPLAAQQVISVKSGEHEGFSRLVLRVDPSVTWEVVNAHGRATLRFPDHEYRFSTVRVFDKITTARISSLTETHPESGSELQLRLNCACEVQSYVFNENYIVLDVYDGPELGPAESVAIGGSQWQPDALPFIQPPNIPARFSAFVMVEAPTQPRLLPDTPPENDPTPAPDMAAPSAPDMVVEVERETHADSAGDGVISDMEALAGAAVSDMNTTVETEDNPEMLARIEEAQAQLLAQLTRAADQGLVNFVPVPVKEIEIAHEAPEPTPAPEPETPELDPLLMQQLSARTAYANTTEDALSDIVNQFAMPQCMDDSVFSMEGWGGEEGFSEQLASLRRALLGEFDTMDEKKAEQIVQLYLRYGLGAEARLMLREHDFELEHAALYQDMAALIEGEPELAEGPILQGAGCGGAHEMWYLASGSGNYHVLEPLTITDAFSAYPIEVRSLIGPPLAQAFIDREQVEAAHVVLEIVRRAESGVTTAQRMAEAQVMEEQHNLDDAAHVYRDIAIGNSENAPEALIAYARTVLASERPIPDTLLVDLESAAFFNRDTENADPLRLWEIKVRALVAGPEAAMAQITENLHERPHITEELKAIAAHIFEDATADEVGDYPYAQLVLQYSDLLDQGPSGDMARLKIAEEMAAIGLPETALDVLAPNLSRADEPARHIEAAAFVQLYEPAKALDVLEGDEGLEAYKIRLSAYLQMEDFTAVANMLNEDHATYISMNDVALRAGDWAKIKDAGAVGTLASYMQGGAPESEPEPLLAPMMADEAPSLKAVRDLLANNQESMQFLEEVLAEAEGAPHE